ncbi:MAG: triose-phosphate isomerase [Nanoarchaeota archaeon]|nr:triose-phosphate isomerase [Nanoarchaeota archaeon]MBU1632576.1 triose-phosphate isomerase [Nanoarchaeota archaeon]MBU1875786.1 triose-phosphate isomerase [Nanoarchaeota archaeon]
MKKASKPLVLINFKTYKEAAGKKALFLAKQLVGIKENRYEIIVAPSLLTIKEIAERTKLKIFSQHADNVTLGAHTGSISIEELISIGVKGTILNHSEKKIPLHLLKETVEICKNKKFTTVVCASTLSEIKKIAGLCPDYIAYEPKELIGGNISVTQSKPEIIIKAVELVKNLCPKAKLLCGAGVHSKEDLGQALLLGSEGVLIGHAVPKAKNPGKFLKEMLI